MQTQKKMSLHNLLKEIKLFEMCIHFEIIEFLTKVQWSLQVVEKKTFENFVDLNVRGAQHKWDEPLPIANDDNVHNRDGTYVHAISGCVHVCVRASSVCMY